MTGTGALQHISGESHTARSIPSMQLSTLGEGGNSIDISKAIQSKVIRVLHRIPNIMTDVDSMMYLIYLVNRKLLRILGDEIAITPILVNRKFPLVRPELLGISQPMIQMLASNYPLDPSIETIALPLRLESQPLLNVHFPKSRLYNDSDARLIEFSVQSVLDILVAKYVSGIREKKNLDLAQANLDLAQANLDLAQANLDLAMTDQLLKIPSRRALDKIIQEYQSLNSLGMSFPVSVIMIDLDHFKKVNDTYGHDVGDRVLKHVADIIRSECDSHGSSADIFRMSGEELVCIVRNCDSLSAIDFAKKINNRIYNTPYFHDNILIRQTVSIGVSIAENASHFSNIKYDDGTDGGVRILKEADLAMYEAKKIRNTVREFSKEHSLHMDNVSLERRTGSRKGV